MSDRLADADLNEIQSLVFRAWKWYPYAAFHFVRLSENVEHARAWLTEMEGAISWASDAKERTVAIDGAELDIRVQLALTTSGLSKLGVPWEVVDRFPFELKAGIERRANVIGDPIDDFEDPSVQLRGQHEYERIWEPDTRKGRPQPNGWTLDLRRCDAVLLLYAKSTTDRDKVLAWWRTRARELHAYPMGDELTAKWTDHEPFGFADGVSNPAIRGHAYGNVNEPMEPMDPDAKNGGGEKDASKNTIAAGEIVLGYTNEYGHVPKSPAYLDKDGNTRFDLGKNGTFLVFRKLEQNVRAFWTTFLELGKRWKGQPVSEGAIPDDDVQAAKWLAARAMGRWPNGNSTLLCPFTEGEQHKPEKRNAFTYADDEDGTRCPISSHVRRANPRDQREPGDPGASWKVVRRHRILRRGRAYGEQMYTIDKLLQGTFDEASTGLYFICLQANITHGFEFVQQLWNNNPSFHGTFREPDLVAGPGGARFTIPADPVRVRLQRLTPKPPPDEKDEEEKKRRRGEDPLGLPRFVTARGGGYFFVPSRSAVAKLLEDPQGVA